MTDLPATAEPGAAGDFRVGGVFGRSFGILGRNALVFTPLGALAALPTLLEQGFARSGGASQSGTKAGLVLLALLLEPCVQAVVVYGAFQDMRGKEVRLGESLGKGLARLFPVIGASISVGVVVGLGVLLLIVPGLIAVAAFYVTISACVVERLGPFKSMDRSAWLTKGHRWKVLGIALLLAVAGAIAEGIMPRALAPLGGPMAATLGLFVWRACMNSYAAIVAVVAYHDLRVAKEGVDIERIAAVFD